MKTPHSNLRTLNSRVSYRIVAYWRESYISKSPIYHVNLVIDGIEEPTRKYYVKNITELETNLRRDYRQILRNRKTTPRISRVESMNKRAVIRDITNIGFEETVNKWKGVYSPFQIREIMRENDESVRRSISGLKHIR